MIASLASNSRSKDVRDGDTECLHNGINIKVSVNGDTKHFNSRLGFIMVWIPGFEYILTVLTTLESEYVKNID